MGSGLEKPRRAIAAFCAMLALLVVLSAARAQTQPATPKTFDEAHSLYMRHRGALEDALKAAFRAKCLDQKAVDAIHGAELAIGGLKNWTALLQQWPFFAPIPPVAEPVASPGELKGRVAWAQFMVGRLAFHIGHLRKQKPCEGIAAKPPADKTAATADANPGCQYNDPASKLALKVGEIQVEMQKLVDERDDQESKIESANDTLSKIGYYRSNPNEKPADFDLAAKSAEARAVKQGAEIERERINARLRLLAPQETKLREELEEMLNCSEPAPGLDRCLIGTWRSEPIINVGVQAPGGDGIVLTVKEDGSAMIDYSKMREMRTGAKASNLWQGTATGRIESKDGKLSLARAEKSEVTAKLTDQHGKITTNKLSGFGPVLPEKATVTYRCDKDILTTTGFGYDLTFKRAP